MTRPDPKTMAVETVPNLVKALRSRRRELGLSQSELAGLAGLSIEGLSKIERGDAEPKLSTVIQLVKLLGGAIQLGWRRA